MTGRESPDQLSGPIGIARVSGEVAKVGGVGGLIGLIALLSVSIGLLNLFPVPLLDGGHLLFYAFEAVRGRPLSARAQEIGFRIGTRPGAVPDAVRGLERPPEPRRFLGAAPHLSTASHDAVDCGNGLDIAAAIPSWDTQMPRSQR